MEMFKRRNCAIIDIQIYLPPPAPSPLSLSLSSKVIYCYVLLLHNITWYHSLTDIYQTIKWYRHINKYKFPASLYMLFHSHCSSVFAQSFSLLRVIFCTCLDCSPGILCGCLFVQYQFFHCQITKTLLSHDCNPFTNRTHACDGLLWCAGGWCNFVMTVYFYTVRVFYCLLQWARPSKTY